MNRLTPYAKALVAGLAAFASGMAVAYTDNHLTNGELWTAIAGALAALAATYQVRNQ